MRMIKKIHILFINTLMYKEEEKKLSNRFHDLNKDYRFEVMSCQKLPNAYQLTRAQIVICYAKKFNEQSEEIKKIITTNSEAWFAVWAHTGDHREISKNLGDKYCLLQHNAELNEHIIDEFLIKKYLKCSAEQITLGAGFNNETI